MLNVHCVTVKVVWKGLSRVQECTLCDSEGGVVGSE